MTRKRPSEPSPDLGSLSAVLAPAADERRGVQVGLAVAAVLHAVFFAVTWPSLAGGERATSSTTTRIYPTRQYEFTPPDPELVQLPQLPQRLVAIPDSTPDDPEPEIRMVRPEIPFIPSSDLIPVRIEAPPPEDPGPADPVVVGVDIQAPRILTKVDPRYTETARAVRKQGAVVLELLIDEQGTVAEITVLRGLPLGLTECAVDAVRQWRFEPSTLGDRPVAVRYTLTVHFRLE